MKIAIHQPNFFPWYGYFEKISKSQIFIFLDDAEVHKKNLDYLNRTFLLINGKIKYFSVPIKKNFKKKKILEIEIDKKKNWKNDFLNLLNENYKKTKYFDETINVIEKILKYETDKISEFNINSIKKLSYILGIKSKNKISSSYSLKSTSTERLIDLVKLNNCHHYISGEGAKSYLNTTKFLKENIEITFHKTNIKSYKQNSNSFHSGLSIIDLLMNEGLIKSKKIINEKLY